MKHGGRILFCEGVDHPRLKSAQFVLLVPELFISTAITSMNRVGASFLKVRVFSLVTARNYKGRDIKWNPASEAVAKLPHRDEPLVTTLNICRKIFALCLSKALVS
jgi:hypothetical protein